MTRLHSEDLLSEIAENIRMSEIIMIARLLLDTSDPNEVFNRRESLAKRDASGKQTVPNREGIPQCRKMASKLTP